MARGDTLKTLSLAEAGRLSVCRRPGVLLALMLENSGLGIIFVPYAGLYLFDWGPWMAGALDAVSHLFFALWPAMKTCVQKIAAPGNIAPTAAMALTLTINHIAAVFLPAVWGYLWLSAPAAVSLALACLLPRHPERGREIVLLGGVAAPAR